MKDKEYRSLQKNFKNFLTEDINMEMAVSPNDVDVFPGKNYSSAKIANEIEKLTDESLEYLNLGKKGKKPTHFTSSAVKKNEITLKFTFNKDKISSNPELNSFYDILRPRYMYKDDYDFKKNYTREFTAWQKIRSVLYKKYTTAGWKSISFESNNSDKGDGFDFYVWLTK